MAYFPPSTCQFGSQLANFTNQPTNCFEDPEVEGAHSIKWTAAALDVSVCTYERVYNLTSANRLNNYVCVQNAGSWNVPYPGGSSYFVNLEYFSLCDLIAWRSSTDYDARKLIAGIQYNFPSGCPPASPYGQIYNDWGSTVQSSIYTSPCFSCTF